MLDKVIQILFKLAFWKVLWENAAVAGDFPAQTIAANELSDYKFVAIEASTVTDNTVAIDSQTRRKIDIFRTDMEEKGALTYGGFINRTVSAARGASASRTLAIDGNNVIFSAGVKTLFNDSAVQDDTLCRPTRIYGILHK